MTDADCVNFKWACGGGVDVMEQGERRKWKKRQIRVGWKEGGMELRGGAGITVTTPHHRDGCLVIRRG